MTIEDIIIQIVCFVDDEMMNVRRHSQGKLCAIEPGTSVCASNQR